MTEMERERKNKNFWLEESQRQKKKKVGHEERKRSNMRGKREARERQGFKREANRNGETL
jgi:hypothetical protein